MRQNLPVQIKYFIYTRKSTRGADKQILSIKSQRDAISDLLSKQNLIVVDEIEEKESAHMPGRPEFGKMMKRIEKGEASGIIAWHPDRLARNSLDGGQIIHFLDIGKLADLKFCSFWFENTPQGKSMLGHEFVNTKQYSDKLGHDTWRGLHDKAKAGEFPGRAPVGYLNDCRTKRIVIDRERAPIIREAFELYASEGVDIDDLREFLAAKGITTRNGKRLLRGSISVILNNPFYYGHFQYAGELYEGVHQSIISKELFDDVQAILATRYRWSRTERRPKAFTKLMRCDGCGSAITAEIQKGHIYYRCSKKNKAMHCGQPYVREEELIGELSRLMGPFALTSECAEKMLTLAQKEKRELRQAADRAVGVDQKEIGAITAKLDRLLEIFLSGDIEREAYNGQKAKLLGRKKQLQEKIEALSGNPLVWLEPFTNWLNTAKTLGKTLKTGSLEEQRVLARKIFGSNLYLDRRKARGCATKPWSFIPETSQNSAVVEPRGFEPLTPTMPLWCSTN